MEICIRSKKLIELIKLWTQYIATLLEGVAGGIIILAAVQATIQAFPLFLPGRQNTAPHQEPRVERIRLRFSRWLTLALEFELSTDILRTAVAPTWSDIGQLAAIAAIRTLLNYFLQKEIDRAASKELQTMNGNSLQ